MAVKVERYTVDGVERTIETQDDPMAVTRVWFAVASDSMTVDEFDGDSDPDMDSRMTYVLGGLGLWVQEKFPKATDVSIINGGFENQYAWFAPSRIQDADGLDYEGEFSVLAMADHMDVLIGEAFKKWPVLAVCAVCGERINGMEYEEGVTASHNECASSPDPDGEPILNVPCMDCGRTDQPLHTDYRCPDCHQQEIIDQELRAKVDAITETANREIELVAEWEAEGDDDDPVCTNCGIHRSEHGMAPCDGFTTQPGGFVVYTGEDLAQMSPEELDELLSRGNEAVDPDDATLGPCPVPVAEANIGKLANQVWIVGKGWVDRASVTCVKCGDEGRIVTAWEDDGDAESGPHLVATGWDHCDCLNGWKAKAGDLAEELSFLHMDRLARQTEVEIDRDLQGKGVATAAIVKAELHATGETVQPLLAVGELTNIVENARQKLAADPNWRLRIRIITEVLVESPESYERRQVEGQ